MRSRTTAQFRSLRAALPKRVQEKAVSAYKLWSANPEHPSLRFKKVHKMLPIYSVRIDRAWRAVGVLSIGVGQKRRLRSKSAERLSSDARALIEANAHPS